MNTNKNNLSHYHQRNNLASPLSSLSSSFSNATFVSYENKTLYQRQEFPLIIKARISFEQLQQFEKNALLEKYAKFTPQSFISPGVIQFTVLWKCCGSTSMRHNTGPKCSQCTEIYNDSPIELSQLEKLKYSSSILRDDFLSLWSNSKESKTTTTECIPNRITPIVDHTNVSVTQKNIQEKVEMTKTINSIVSEMQNLKMETKRYFEELEKMKTYLKESEKWKQCFLELEKMKKDFHLISLEMENIKTENSIVKSKNELLEKNLASLQKDFILFSSQPKIQNTIVVEEESVEKRKNIIEKVNPVEKRKNTIECTQIIPKNQRIQNTCFSVKRKKSRKQSLCRKKKNQKDETMKEESIDSGLKVILETKEEINVLGEKGTKNKSNDSLVNECVEKKTKIEEKEKICGKRQSKEKNLTASDLSEEYKEKKLIKILDNENDHRGDDGDDNENENIFSIENISEDQEKPLDSGELSISIVNKTII